MAALKDGRFWMGFLVGYFLLVIFPSVNIRALGASASIGRG